MYGCSNDICVRSYQDDRCTFMVLLLMFIADVYCWCLLLLHAYCTVHAKHQKRIYRGFRIFFKLFNSQVQFKQWLISINNRNKTSVIKTLQIIVTEYHANWQPTKCCSHTRLLICWSGLSYIVYSIRVKHLNIVEFNDSNSSRLKC